MIQSVLVANRGEIACRIIRTAKQLGIHTVAVYSEADRNSPHVGAADQAVCIGPAEVSASYLNIDAILAAAEATAAESIHPGYGFLSENSAFAEACQRRGITFIGPNSHAIELMGNKRAAKIAVQGANVPCVPGFEGNKDGSPISDSELMNAALTIGFPVLIKAAAGGGGRGMRIVESNEAMAAALQSARSEALNAFGSDELILEKYIESPRHIEIQVFADQQGNTIHLGERDCSIQRRHQKVIEESPSPALSAEHREEMGLAAVATAKACRYVGAGTVEFITDPEGHFYFLEMNTRLQVEHPVTELVTGIDLVEWQFKIASGNPLPLQQHEIQHRGHAIEVRLYAEDVHQQFLPQTGRITGLHIPSLPNSRIDHAVCQDLSVSPFYDPMLGKWIAWGEDRASAIQQITALLKQTHICGVTTNRAFLLALLKHDLFQQGLFSTHFIEQHKETLLQAPLIPSTHLIAAALFLTHNLADATASNAGRFRRSTALQRQTLLTLSTGRASSSEGTFSLGDTDAPYQLRGTWIENGSQQWSIALQGENEVADEHLFSAQLINYNRQNSELTLLINAVSHKIALSQQDNTLYIDSEDGHFTINDITYPTHSTLNDDLDSDTESGSVTAPMDGKIVAINIKPGQTVANGDILMIIEAMKMEHPVKARQDGQVSRIDVETNQQAKRNQLLATID